MNLTFTKARKKPIDLDVIQLTDEIWNEIYSEESHDIQINGYSLQASFITEEYLYPDSEAKTGVAPVEEQRKVFFVNTLEDVSSEKLHKAEIGDWLIVGVRGEIYACEKSIFEDTYEIVKGSI